MFTGFEVLEMRIHSCPDRCLQEANLNTHRTRLKIWGEVRYPKDNDVRRVRAALYILQSLYVTSNSLTRVSGRQILPRVQYLISLIQVSM